MVFMAAAIDLSSFNVSAGLKNGMTSVSPVKSIAAVADTSNLTNGESVYEANLLIRFAELNPLALTVKLLPKELSIAIERMKM